MQVDALSTIEGLARRSNLDRSSISDLSQRLVEELVTETMIDALLARAIESDDDKLFNNALMAALDAKIPVDAQRLVKGMVLLDNLLLMFPVYCHYAGDFAKAYLEAHKTGQMRGEDGSPQRNRSRSWQRSRER